MQTARDNARTQPLRSHPKTQPSFFVPGGPRMRFVRALDAYAPRSFGPIFACFADAFVAFASLE